MYNVNGGLMGGGERSPSHSIEVPWIERKDDLLTAALPVEVIIRENDGLDRSFLSFIDLFLQCSFMSQRRISLDGRCSFSSISG